MDRYFNFALYISGKMPRKVFNLSTKHNKLIPLMLPPSLNVMEALSRVFKLTSVGSKRYLTNKVCINYVIIHIHTYFINYTISTKFEYSF